jgi:hypothetical protein
VVELTLGLGGSTQFLSFLYFSQRFTVDAKRSGGSSLKALDPDLDAAGVTIAVVVIL